MGNLKMPDINRVMIAGRIAKDVQTRKVGTGATVAQFTVCVSKKIKSKTGDARDEVCYVDCVCWDKQAEYVAANMPKGTPVIVEGFLKQESWDDKTTGQKRSKIVLNCISAQSIEWMEDNNAPRKAAGLPQEASSGQNDDDIPF